jgi:hypothetical protein
LFLMDMDWQLLLIVITPIMTCNFFWCLVLQKNAQFVKIDGYERVPANDELALKKAIANQPISVAVDGSDENFEFYESVSFFINFTNKN